MRRHGRLAASGYDKEKSAVFAGCLRRNGRRVIGLGQRPIATEKTGSPRKILVHVYALEEA